jgi:hypothetical protein
LGGREGSFQVTSNIFKSINPKKKQKKTKKLGRKIEDKNQS